MRKDINMPKVEDVALAVVREKNEEEQWQWSVYIINLKEVPLTGVLIASKGYGTKNGEGVKTSILRHFFEQINPKTYHKVEMITDDLVTLSNEFWVSFYINQQVYDKKYVFVADVIQKEYFTDIPLMDVRGILIQ